LGEDAVLVFPGEIPGMSGVFNGKEAIRAWYQRDFEQFPITRRRLKSVAVSNLFDLTGNNIVAVHWDFEGTSHNGVQIENSGVSMITIKGGKVVNIHIYVFDTGEKFRAAWK
jgi:ketosteroid isomerase-like protein